MCRRVAAECGGAEMSDTTEIQTPEWYGKAVRYGLIAIVVLAVALVLALSLLE